MAFIEVKRLSREYIGGFRLNDISFDIDKGQTLTLMGPSGSGKTSLLRNLSGLDVPDSGSIKVDGREVASLPPQKRGVGMIFQDLALFPHMTVYDNIAYGLRSLKEDERKIRDRIEDIAEVLQIGDLMERYPSYISGGQRQRVALARSVLPGPDLLLLDEPMSSLDTPLRSTVRAEMKMFAKEMGLTMVYVTHDHHEGFYMADLAGVIFEGTLLRIDDPERLFSDPKEGRIASFLGYNVLTHKGRSIGVYPGDIDLVERDGEKSGVIRSAGYEGDLLRITVAGEDGKAIQVWLPPGKMELQQYVGRKVQMKFTRTVELQQ